VGSRGTKATTTGDDASAATVRVLEQLGAVTSKSMFGGHGILREGVMFAIVDSGGRLYFRADETTAADYEAASSARHPRMPYREVPPAVRAKPGQLIEWAETAADVAARNRKR